MLDEARGRAARAQSATGPRPVAEVAADRRRDPRADERQPVPLRRLRRTSSPRSRTAGGGVDEAVRLRSAPTDAADGGRRRGRPARRAPFLAGGTNLVDQMKLGVASPDLLVDVSRLPLDRVEALPGRRAADRRERPQQRPGRRPARAARLPGAVPGAAGRCVRPAPQHGHDRRQPAPAHPLRATSRTSPRRATSGSRARGCPARRGLPPQPGDPRRSEHCVATHPSDLAVALAALDAVVRDARPATASGAIPIEELLPAARRPPARDTVLDPAS